jgi:signal transduction histidine kinase
MAMPHVLSRSIKARIIITLVVIVVSILALFEIYGYRVERQLFTRELEEFAQRKISRLADNLSFPVWEIDDRWVDRIIDSEMTDQNVYALTVRGDGGLHAGKVRDGQWRAVDTAAHDFTGDLISLNRNVVYGNEKIGVVAIYLTRKFMEERLREKAVYGGVTAIGLTVFLVIFLVLFLNRVIIRPLRDILAGAKAVGEGDYSRDITIRRPDEIGMLAHEVNLMSGNISHREQELDSTLLELRRKSVALQNSHNEMERKVEERTRELRNANERLKEMDRLKSMFIASMSHELRTPLNSILGFTGMTLDGLSGDLNEEQQDNLRRVHQSGRHLLGLITDVIDISKIEAGRVEVYTERFSLKEIIHEAVASVLPEADKKQIKLVIDAPAWPEIVSDRKRLMQCLLNFLSNAVKFSEQGSVTVTVRQLKDDVQIGVRDTGIGIDRDDMDKLFVAFERLETHLRVKAGGTGLGLYLTRKIATELLGGSVWVESEIGRGSTFWLRIPKEIG